MTMATLDEVRQNLDQLLGRLEEEKEIVITSHDQPVARIMPPERPRKWPDFLARQRALFGGRTIPGNAVAEMRAL